MTTEDTAEADPRILKESPAGAIFEAHFSQFELCEKLKPREAFAVAKTDPATGLLLRLDVLRQIADALSVGKRVFVVIEHSTAFEVRRLEDGRPAKLFYQLLAVEAGADQDGEDDHGQNQSREQTVWNAIQEAFRVGHAAVLSYDRNFSAEMMRDNIVPYSYIHRKVFSKHAFKKSQEGGTEAIKKTIFNLMQAGKLVALSKEFGQTTYKTTAQLYRVIEE